MTQADSVTIVAAVLVLPIVSLLMSEHPGFSKKSLSNRRAKVRDGVTMRLSSIRRAAQMLWRSYTWSRNDANGARSLQITRRLAKKT
jgi:hypothetical protein